MTEPRDAASPGAVPRSAAVARLALAAQSSLAGGREPLVLLDLDGTLYDTRARTWRILQEFGRQHAAEHPALLAAITRLTLREVSYLVGDTLTRIGVADGDVIAQVEEYWRARFFTGAYVRYDLPAPGAVAFVQALRTAGVVPCYLTGRDAPATLVGTVRTLQRDGFPVGTPDTRVILKESSATPDEHHKRAVLARLRQGGAVIGAFDNEPALCNLFRSELPDATVVHLATTHSPDAPPLLPEIEVVEDFLSLVPASATVSAPP